MRTPDPISPLKEQLARELVARLDGWRQDYAASFVGTDPSRISNLRNGRLTRFSLERLIRFIARDHGAVTLQVTWKSRWHKLRDQGDAAGVGEVGRLRPRRSDHVTPAATPSAAARAGAGAREDAR
jgi:predicted XRE-type DNA-binding protein